MAAPGETDLETMLASLRVRRRPGVFTYVEVETAAAAAAERAHAVVVEDESVTLVLEVDDARSHGFPVVVELAWLTLTVQSSLEAVGLTAAVSARLTALDISCNVIAGYRHDHLLVPVGRADDAAAALSVDER